MEQVQETLSPSPMEQPVQPVADKQLNPGQEANKFLKENLGKAVNIVLQWQGSKKQLQKVMAEWLMFPLSEEYPSFSYPEQKELFDLGNTLNNAKLILFYTGLKEKEVAEEIKARTELSKDNVVEKVAPTDTAVSER